MNLLRLYNCCCNRDDLFEQRFNYLMLFFFFPFTEFINRDYILEQSFNYIMLYDIMIIYYIMILTPSPFKPMSGERKN